MMMGRGKRGEDNEDIGEKGNNKTVIPWEPVFGQVGLPLMGQ